MSKLNSKRLNSRVRYIIVLLSSFVAFTILFTALGGFNGISIMDETFKTESEKIEAPLFSKESGFYDEPFYLSITVPDGMNVYYTLDCTDPDENAILYTEPIYLENATQHENRYCLRTDVSTGFYSDLIEKYQTLDKDPAYVVPDGQVEKCNVVRAIAITNDHQKSDIVSKTYFVGLDTMHFNNANIISVSTDPKNLFDPKIGIYVTGNVFQNALKLSNLGKYWRFWDANYRQKGKKWERDCSVSFFDNDGELIYEQQNSAIRVQGGVSRGTVPRSLNIYSKTEKGNNSIFDTLLFDSEIKVHSFTLASGGNHLYTKLNDYLITAQCSDLNYATMEYKPYVLFLDGEYWGFYWLAERYDETYLSYHYGVNENNILMIKNGDVACGDEAYKVLYGKMLYEITNRDMTIQSNYDYVCSVIDIESCIDYYATMVYIARQEDWPNANFALWRTIDEKNDKYSDGKWRWMMFDCNSTCMKKTIINDNSLEYVVKNDLLFASLWENNEFKNAFQKRLLEIANNCFDSEEINLFLDYYDQAMRPALQKSWERFHGKDNEKGKVYDEEMAEYKEFFAERKAVVESWFCCN